MNYVAIRAKNFDPDEPDFDVGWVWFAEGRPHWLLLLARRSNVSEECHQALLDAIETPPLVPMEDYVPYECPGEGGLLIWCSAFLCGLGALHCGVSTYVREYRNAPTPPALYPDTFEEALGAGLHSTPPGPPPLHLPGEHHP
jgi:hypothetical protein